MGAAEVLDALGHPTRRVMLELLRGGAMPVGVLAEQLPISRPATSQHLRVLKAAGLVSETVRGTRHEYAVDPAGLREVQAWFDQFWADALDRFAALADHNTTSPRGPVDGSPDHGGPEHSSPDDSGGAPARAPGQEDP